MQVFVKAVDINQSNKFWIELNGDRRLLSPNLFAVITNIYERLINGAKYSVTIDGLVTHTHLWETECTKLQRACNDALDFLSSFPDQTDQFISKFNNTYIEYLQEMHRMNVELRFAGKINIINTI
jgi:hypothetical protein